MAVAGVHMNTIRYGLDQTHASPLLRLVWEVADDTCDSDWFPVDELNANARLVRNRLKKNRVALIWQTRPRMLDQEMVKQETWVGECKPCSSC